MKSLDQITLVAIAGVQSDVEPAHAALQFSMDEIRFGAVKLLCCAPPAKPLNSIAYYRIPTFDWIGYNRFVLQQLYQYVDTPYCLLVQSDGFVLNPENWRDEFLQYDYIGAPWPKTLEVRSRVGNGGFSLRSKRLLFETTLLPFDDFAVSDALLHERGEDLWIGHYAYDYLRERGILSASVDVALRFSRESHVQEARIDYTAAFGFHGNKALAGYLLEVRNEQLLSKDLLGKTTSELASWIRCEAGSARPDQYHCERPGRLNLQQVPEQYAAMLDLLRTRKIEHFLQFGIDNGSCLMINTLFLSRSLKIVDAVGRLADGLQIHDLVQKLHMHQQRFLKHVQICCSNSGDFRSHARPNQFYDCILIDLEHTAGDLRREFNDVKSRLRANGTIILHGIHDASRPEMRNLWQEIAHPGCKVFGTGDTCGIGVWFPPLAM